MEKVELKKKLDSLYNDNSKHSNYQNIPYFVSETIGYDVIINEEWRGDSARYKYLLDELEFTNGCQVCDLGANTGFFSLSLSYKFPNVNVTAFEGNKNHVEFMQMIKNYFCIYNLKIENVYIDFRYLERLSNYDIMLNLNVMHHAGVDFDKTLVSFDSFKEYAIKYLKKVSTKTNALVLQMGFNYGGDKSVPIVELSDDIGKMIFIRSICKGTGWTFKKVAYIHRDEEGNLGYRNVPHHIVESIWNSDSSAVAFEEYLSNLNLYNYSEFYRRPIVILENLHK